MVQATTALRASKPQLLHWLASSPAISGTPPPPLENHAEVFAETLGLALACKKAFRATAAAVWGPFCGSAGAARAVPPPGDVGDGDEQDLRLMPNDIMSADLATLKG